tara:strand:+ start:1019 stop:1204 length:186 start_codon:yes stop_codon:yes gene_type:complete
MNQQEYCAREMLIEKWSKLSADFAKIKVNQRILNRVTNSVNQLTKVEVFDLLFPVQLLEEE